MPDTEPNRTAGIISQLRITEVWHARWWGATQGARPSLVARRRRLQCLPRRFSWALARFCHRRRRRQIGLNCASPRWQPGGCTALAGRPYWGGVRRQAGGPLSTREHADAEHIRREASISRMPARVISEWILELLPATDPERAGHTRLLAALEVCPEAEHACGLRISPSGRRHWSKLATRAVGAYSLRWRVT